MILWQGASSKACYNQNNLQALTHQDGLSQAGKVLLHCREKLPSFLSTETATKDQKQDTVHYSACCSPVLSKALDSEYRSMSLRLSILFFCTMSCQSSWTPELCSVLRTIKHLFSLAVRIVTHRNVLLLPYSPARPLRSADAGLLVIPSTKRSTGKRAFVSCFCGIAYPRHIREAGSVDAFKSMLKSFLFSKHYGM